jgi:hypothetical protein
MEGAAVGPEQATARRIGTLGHLWQFEELRVRWDAREPGPSWVDRLVRFLLANAEPFSLLLLECRGRPPRYRPEATYSHRAGRKAVRALRRAMFRDAVCVLTGPGILPRDIAEVYELERRGFVRCPDLRDVLGIPADVETLQVGREERCLLICHDADPILVLHPARCDARPPQGPSRPTPVVHRKASE